MSKKISPRFVVFLIFVYLSFTLTGCPSAPSTKLETDKALINFYDTYNTYEDLYADEKILFDLLQKNADKHDAVLSYLHESVIKLMEKEELGKLIKEDLDLLAEDEETLNAIIEIKYNRKNIESELQGSATKIKDSSKKLLAQEITDKLREINNLEIEYLKLLSKMNKSEYSMFERSLFFLQGKMTEEELQKEIEEADEELKEINKRLDEIENAIFPLMEELIDLKAKLDSLGP